MDDPHARQPALTQGPPPEHARLVLLLLHGRGREAAESLDLARRLNVPDAHVIAPAADRHSWYPQSFLAPTGQNEPHLGRALDHVDRRITTLQRSGVPPERIVLGGFSQGACLAATYAYRSPRRYAAVLVFTGGLIAPPGTPLPPRGDLGGTPVLITSSDADEWVPDDRCRETRDTLSAMHAQVTYRLYPGREHVITDDEIQEARALLGRTPTNG